uniref:Uncharacterized protein n=1 Tax=Anguilla anguilla TaxID=7936 RepID=A0A0E9PK31_ANGAN
MSHTQKAGSDCI